MHLWLWLGTGWMVLGVITLVWGLRTLRRVSQDHSLAPQRVNGVSRQWRGPPWRCLVHSGASPFPVPSAVKRPGQPRKHLAQRARQLRYAVLVEAACKAHHLGLQTRVLLG